MLSYPALKKLRDRLISSAETVLKSDDKKVVDLINRIESQMTPLKKSQYKKYCEIEETFIDKYQELKARYHYKSSGKFSIKRIKNDISEYDKAYKACEKFKNLFGDLCIEAGRCYLMDADNNDLTDDKEQHKKYANWYEEIDTFQDQIYEEIQDQVNEQMSTFNSIVDLVENKLKAIEAEEDEEW